MTKAMRKWVLRLYPLFLKQNTLETQPFIYDSSFFVYPPKNNKTRNKSLKNCNEDRRLNFSLMVSSLIVRRERVHHQRECQRQSQTQS